MYASMQSRPVTYTTLFRSCGRLGGIVVMVSWLTLAIAELFRHGMPAVQAYPQAVTMAVIFAGYIVGWRKELIGGVLATVGTIAFYAVCLGTIDAGAPLASILLALPGVFFLLAWAGDHRRLSHFEWQRHEH